jgi:hypothetical protein
LLQRTQAERHKQDALQPNIGPALVAYGGAHGGVERERVIVLVRLE